MCWFGCRCPPYYCSICNPNRAHLPTPRYDAPQSMVYLNPYNYGSPVYATGPPLSAWSSPRTTVLQYSNGRVQLDDNCRLPSHTSYLAPQYPYSYYACTPLTPYPQPISQGLRWGLCG
ncbi:hypothetical protein B0H10DRAFT_2066336 [Mycena sp. CBHHK59/15]|nr:hypothetical protein B0H10DRAFT_2066336 [Mycena sp. CBHHK59/15]